MKSKRVAFSLTGISLFIAIVITSVWLLSPAKAPRSKELNFDEAIARIENKEASQITIRQDALEITDKNGAKFYTKIDGQESTAEIIFNAADKGGTKINLEPAASGFFRILLINGLPFYVMWGLTLAVIVYAIRVLSRNKG